MPTATEREPEPTRRPEGVPPIRGVPDLDQHRTIADVARKLDVVEQTLGNWVRQERIDRREREGTTTEVREENARLRWAVEAPDHGT
jgi:hypothetical protein